MIAALAYVATILGTNVAFAHAGPVPLTFAIAGLALVTRDWAHEVCGRWRTLGLVGIGAVLSAAAASPAIALASGLAFLVAETLDLLVYDALRRWSRVAGVLASGVVGAVVDSLVFLSVAFGSLAFLQAQVTGKLAATLAAGVVLAVLGAARRRTA